MNERIRNVTFDTFLNSILVYEDIRKGAMLQPQDIKEAYASDPETKKIVEMIKSHFNSLQFSSNYDTYQGIIISKKNYNGQHGINAIEMGKILGYPCYEDFGKISDSDDFYQISLVVTVITTNNDELDLYLFTNKCLSDENIHLFDTIATEATKAFKKYKDVIKTAINITIKEVNVSVNKIVSINSIINKIISNKPLDSQDKDEIMNELYNLIGSSNEMDIPFQFDNPLHKGIILGLLVQSKNNVLSPFFPLHTKHPIEYIKVNQISEEWERELHTIVNQTIVTYPFGEKQIKKSNPKSKPKPNPKPKPKSNHKSKPNPKPKSNHKSKPNPKPKSKSKSKPKRKLKNK